MKMKFCAVLVVLLGVSLVPACASANPPFEGSQPEREAKPGTAWKETWDKLLVEARKEGKVVIALTPGPPEFRVALGDRFKREYGIDLEWVVGAGGEVVPKMKKEREAGLYTIDVAILGASTFATMLEGLTIPIEPMLVLPEVLGANVWAGGKLPFVDKEGHGFVLSYQAQPTYTVNTDMVKPEEIQSSTDLLNPKWKGKIGIGDPTVTGMANTWYTFVVNHLFKLEDGRKFMRNLAQNVGGVTRDRRLLSEWVMRGKYPVGIAVAPSMAPDFMKAGAPITFLDVKEPRAVHTGWGLLNMFNKAPHPKAAQVFVNWLLTKEGGELFEKESNYPSTRTDVPRTVQPIFIARPNDVFVATKEGLALEGRMIGLAGEDFASLLK